MSAASAFVFCTCGHTSRRHGDLCEAPGCPCTEYQPKDGSAIASATTRPGLFGRAAASKNPTIREIGERLEADLADLAWLVEAEEERTR